MLEGYVQGFVNLLLGYLGRYIKDIQKDQLKISLWNGIFTVFSFHFPFQRTPQSPTVFDDLRTISCF